MAKIKEVINILCPECMKGPLKKELTSEECKCDLCGTEFIRINHSTVRYKQDV